MAGTPPRNQLSKTTMTWRHDDKLSCGHSFGAVAPPFTERSYVSEKPTSACAEKNDRVCLIEFALF